MDFISLVRMDNFVRVPIQILPCILNEAAYGISEEKNSHGIMHYVFISLRHNIPELVPIHILFVFIKTTASQEEISLRLAYGKSFYYDRRYLHHHEGSYPYIVLRIAIFAIIELWLSFPFSSL